MPLLELATLHIAIAAVFYAIGLAVGDWLWKWFH
jgi:hypothetical protein